MNIPGSEKFWAYGALILFIVGLAFVTGLVMIAFSGCEKTESQDVTKWLYWTAVGDDGIEGQASSYDMRIYHEDLTDANWFLAAKVNGLPVPSPSGQTDSARVTYPAGQAVWVGIRAIDDAGNMGPVSDNNVEIDACFPAMIIDLRDTK